MSYVSSAGIARGAPSYGTTCRKNVLRGVDVPVMPSAAGRARPVTCPEVQERKQVPTCRAGLGRGVPAVDDDQAAAVPLALVLQLSAELAPPAVRDRAGQGPVTDHVPDRKVLDHDHVVLAYQAGASAVQEISPSIADLAVTASDFGLRLGPVSRPVPATGHASLVSRQPAGLALQVPGIGDSLAVRGHGEVPYAEVDADSMPGWWERFGVVRLDGKGDVPAAVRLPRDNDHSRLERGHVDIWPRPGEPQRRVHLGQPQLTAAHGERAASIVCGLPGAAGLESGIAGAAGEERRERLVLVAQCLLQRHRGHLVEECQIRVPLHRSQRSVRRRIRRALALGMPASTAVGQSPVPHNPDAAERAVEYCLLLLVGVGAASVCCPHRSSIALLIEKFGEPRRTGDDPGPGQLRGASDSWA